MAWLQFVEKSLAFLERAFSREFDSSRMLRPDPIPRSVPPIETRLARGEVRFLERKTALHGALPWRLELPCKRVQELSWVNVLVWITLWRSSRALECKLISYYPPSSHREWLHIYIRVEFFYTKLFGWKKKNCVHMCCFNSQLDSVPHCHFSSICQAVRYVKASTDK